MAPPAPATTLFAAFLVGAALALVGLHGSDAGVDALLRRQHLRPASVAEWVAVQPLPGMYTFANRAWASTRPTPCDGLDVDTQDPEAVPLGYVNHYPTRLVTFQPDRYTWGAPGAPSWLHVESRVRGRALWSTYHVEHSGDALTMTLAECAPGCQP